MQADRPKARGRLTKLSNTAIATDVPAANARLPQRSTDCQAPAASTQTQAQGLTPSVRQGSDAEAPAIDSDQTIRGGEEQPVVAAHSRQSLPLAAAANGLAIQPADESIAPAQITSSDRPTWIPIRRAADSSLCVLCQADAKRRQLLAVASQGPPANSMAATEHLARSLRSFLVGDQQQLLQQLSEAVVLAPSALAQIDTSLLSEWARQADEGAQVMTALRDRLLQAHGEAIAGRVKATLHAAAPILAADDTAADRCCSREDPSTGRDAAGSGLPDLSAAGRSSMAVDKPACPAEHVAVDDSSIAKAATARLPASGLQQLQLQRLKHATFPEAAQAVGHATDLQAATGQRQRGLQPAGPVEADAATDEEAAVKADAQQRQQRQHQAAKCAPKRKRTGKGLHGQQAHEPVAGQGVRADSADQATQQSAAPAELVGIPSAVSMIPCLCNSACWMSWQLQCCYTALPPYCGAAPIMFFRLI